jgi:hypothetical protein
MFQIRWGIVSERLPPSWGNDSKKPQAGGTTPEADLDSMITVLLHRFTCTDSCPPSLAALTGSPLRN